MNSHARSAIESAQRRLEYATHLIQDAVDSGHERLVGAAFAELLLARGELAAGMQLLELDDTLGKAGTERPVLRIVGR